MDSIKDLTLEILDESGNGLLLEDILNSISSESNLIRFIHRYTIFNLNFAGGVLNLAGEVHTRPDLFRENGVIYPLADRSSEVAAHIFAAAEDEYVHRETGTRVTHRQMAQALLIETLSYFEVNLERFEEEYRLNPAIESVLVEGNRKYCVNRTASETDLLRALGFHVGAELLGSQEFSLIDRYLKSKHPDFVRHLKNSRTPYGLDPYRWISLHSAVEEEHFEHAIIAADKAIGFYSGRHTKDYARSLILKGVRDFCRLQMYFFENVLKN